MQTIDLTTAAVLYPVPSSRGTRHVLMLAIADGWTINSHASEDDARHGLTADDADDLAAEDPALIYLTRETLESPLVLARLTSIASNLGDQVIAAAAESERDPWAKLDEIASDFKGSVRAWQTEGGAAGDVEVCAWADAVLSLADPAMVREAYLEAAGATVTRIAGPRLALADLADGHYAVRRDGVWSARLTIDRPDNQIRVPFLEEGRRLMYHTHRCTDGGLRSALADVALPLEGNERIGELLGSIDGAAVAVLTID